jgi:MarR family transcriptional regulator, transcriptional regulator for hemolysin
MEKLNDLFFYNLEKATKAYRQYFQNQLKRHGFDITLDQWLLLRTVSEYPDSPQNDIAEKMFKDKASVTRIIELLVQNGFLQRTIHPTNRRMFQLTLTDKAWETLNALKDLVIEFRQDALEGIEAQILNDTQQVMRNIVSNCKNKTSK